MSLESPGVSVLVRTHEGAASILETLESLTGQTLEPDRFEILVVPNGPDDGTVELVRDFRDRHHESNIRIIWCPVTGVGPSTNVGMAAARREYVTIVDDDDTVSPSFLSSLLAVARPDTIAHAYLADVSPDEDFPDFDTYVNRSVTRASGRTVHPAEVRSALSFNTAKLVLTRHARAVRARENLRFGTDVVFWNTLANRFKLSVTVVPTSDHAIYYRHRRIGSYSRPAELSREMGISARLDTIEALWPIYSDPTQYGHRAARHAVQSAARGIGEFLHEHPDDHELAVDEIKDRRLEPFPWRSMNRDRARDLATCYAFLPSNNTSAIVGGRRVRAHGLAVDLITQDLSSRFEHDRAALDIVKPYVGNQHTVGGRPGERTWAPMAAYALEGIEKIAEWERAQGPYRSVYSRAMWPASHVLAALHKVRRPSTFWIAEFSDPLSHGLRSQPRRSGRGEDALTEELDLGLRQAGFKPPSGELLMPWIEHLAYVLADEILFTNEHQRSYMISHIDDEALRRRVLDQSVVTPHPTLPPEFYQRSDATLARKPDTVHVAYFGAFYVTRGLTEVVDAVRRLDASQRSRLEIHVYTKDPRDLGDQLKKHKLTGIIKPHPYVHYLDFLHLTTQFDCLIVNDARTLDTHEVNPYLPSKLSDYRGSGRPIWAVVEPGSILSRQDVEHMSELGDVEGALRVLTDLLGEGQAPTTSATTAAIR
ncbi:glycosyltransferase [Aeromicrobium terrae]|uniref:Glycosyltransferase n=1 Tax=Aeromicrobium terrae TaxID=2498846 RepID=A0A5C8NNF2_9ACTN|nr:glycosyltransferase [Aeromicrobium terrae]TXL62321.1 glycosyltransferase [Aeromicrobium terrae]